MHVNDLAPLDILLDDPSVRRITVETPNQVFASRVSGEVVQTEVSFRDEEHLFECIQYVAAMVRRLTSSIIRFDASVPLLDRRLPDGSRLRAKIPPISSTPSLSIEKGGTCNPFDSVVGRN